MIDQAFACPARPLFSPVKVQVMPSENLLFRTLRKTLHRVVDCALMAISVLALTSCAGELPVTAGQERVHPGAWWAQEGKPSGMLPPADEGQSIEKVDHDAESSIFFMLGSSSITPEERLKVQSLAIRLKEDRNLGVILIGHANDNGSRSFNLAVADSRVRAVVDQLRKQGVTAQQIRFEVAGSEQVPRDCRTSTCRQIMRRVEWRFFALR